jgi:hypothetical protein
MTKTEDTTRSVRPLNFTTSYTARSHSICFRCGGLMVNEVCIDLVNSTSELDCTARRCIQCGDIVDAVILRNRSLHQRPGTTQDQPASVH